MQSVLQEIREWSKSGWQSRDRLCGGFSTPVPTQSLRSKTEGPSRGQRPPLSFRQTTTAKSSRCRQLLSAFAFVFGEGE